MISTFDFPTIAQGAAGQIGNCLVEGTVILLLTAALARGLRRQSSGARFALWFTALIAIAAVGIFDGRLFQAHIFATAEKTPAVTLPASWAFYLFFAWIAAAGAALLRIGAGVWQLNTLRKTLVILDNSELPAEVRVMQAEFARYRKIAICLSDEIQSPTAIGLLKPAVILPRWIMEESSPEELRQILLHEMAHLRRWDDWSNLLQKVLKALLIFHPAVWWIESRLSLEREMACDDAVLAETHNPLAYAECLTRLAEKSFFRRSMLLAQAAVSRFHQTTLRVTQILDGKRTNGAQAGKLLIPGLGLFMATSMVLVAHIPRLVAFESPASQIATISHPSLPVPEIRKSSPATFEQVATKQSLAGIGANTNLDSMQEESRAVVAWQPSASTPNRIAPTLAAMRRPGSLGNVSAHQTFVVFVETQQEILPGQLIWQVQMWQVTVWHPTNPPTAQPTSQKVI